MSQPIKSKPKQSKRNWQINNSYRCFGILDVLLIIGVIILFLLPFIDIFLYQYAKGYNVIDWGEYYNSEGTNYNYSITGISRNGTLDYTNSNYSLDYQTFQMKTMYQEMRVPVDKDQTKFKNISFGMRDYQFLMNGSSDLTFTSQYTFPLNDIAIFYPMMFRLPIHILSAVNDSTYNHDTEVWKTQTLLKGLPIAFPSTWNSVWDNLEVYFYYVNDNNDGIGFRYGNQQFNGTPEEHEIITDFGTLQLQTYQVNISSDFQYTINTSIIGTPPVLQQFPNMRYHSNPISDQTPVGQYTSIFGQIPNPLDTVDNLIGTLPFDISLTGSLFPNALSFDNPLYEISQLQGFPQKNELPTIQASKCGYYIIVKDGFDCSEALNWSINSNEYIYDQIKRYKLVNGIEVNDDGIVLGQIPFIKDTLYQLLLYDVLIFGSYLAIVTIFIFANKVPQKYKAFQQLNKQYCQIKPK